MLTKSVSCFGIAVLAIAASSVQAAEITRVPFGRPTGIATSVSVPAGYKLHFISGQLPTVDPKAPGNMETQTRDVVGKLVAELKRLGLKPSDAVKATVFMMPDPAKNGEMNFPDFTKAWMEAWPGTSKELPARSTIKISGLAVPGALLEIEMIAASPN